MAFDEQLAARIRKALSKRVGVMEKKMFGGIAFLLRGNMCCGVHGSDLIVRLDAAATDGALSAAHTRPFDLTGRAMKGWILVQPKGIATDAALGKWIATAVKYAESLPAK
ncbi:MAG: TfoX/Sxy family protein [Vicinamibacterales bacterium]